MHVLVQPSIQSVGSSNTHLGNICCLADIYRLLKNVFIYVLVFCLSRSDLMLALCPTQKPIMTFCKAGNLGVSHELKRGMLSYVSRHVIYTCRCLPED